MRKLFVHHALAVNKISGAQNPLIAVLAQEAIPQSRCSCFYVSKGGATVL
jgi:hypothetical protein